MDRIKQLKERQNAVKAAGKIARNNLNAIIDESSFVELMSLSYSKGERYDENAKGEGLVTGFATIEGNPFVVIAQNFEDGFGGLTKANCDKIVSALNAAAKNFTPVLYLLHCQGVKVSDGIGALEGIAKILNRATQLKGSVLQYAVLTGEVYGAAAALAAVCDAVFFTPDSALAVTSPLVLAAKSDQSLKKEEVGGYAALKHTALPAVEVKSLREAKEKIITLTGCFFEPVVEAELNEPLPALNKKADAKTILSLFEESVELGANCASELHTVVGRIGGIAVAAAIFDNVKLNATNLKKLRDFAALACNNSLPFVTFVDCGGVEHTLDENDSTLLREISSYLGVIEDIEVKLAVVTGQAAGLGYSLLAAKSLGFDVTYAFATADISLFDKEMKGVPEEDSDPVNAAKDGYLDNVVEPQFIKQYLIASLQMLLK